MLLSATCRAAGVPLFVVNDPRRSWREKGGEEVEAGSFEEEVRNIRLGRSSPRRVSAANTSATTTALRHRCVAQAEGERWGGAEGSEGQGGGGLRQGEGGGAEAG